MERRRVFPAGRPAMTETLCERLGLCLDAPPARLPDRFALDFAGDHRLNEALLEPEWFERPLTAAAVLVPLMDYGNAARLLFTQRTADLKRHGGQISFPGGRQDDGDRDLVATALREAEEEIGLPPSRVAILGALEPYVTVTGFIVAPIVARVEPGFVLRPDPREVSEAFEVPFDFLMDERNHRLESGQRGNVTRHWWAMPWQTRHIWGATAGMIRSLSTRYRATIAQARITEAP